MKIKHYTGAENLNKKTGEVVKHYKIINVNTKYVNETEGSNCPSKETNYSYCPIKKQIIDKGIIDLQESIDNALTMTLKEMLNKNISPNADKSNSYGDMTNIPTNFIDGNNYLKNAEAVMEFIKNNENISNKNNNNSSNIINKDNNRDIETNKQKEVDNENNKTTS